MKISVVMPVYNTGERLYKTLVSLLGQTEKDFEVLLVDDDSLDPLTIEIENTFCRFDPRFHLLKSGGNNGPAVCRNTGMKAAAGRYIIFLDSDDLFMPEMLETYADALDKNNARISIGSFIMRDVNTDETSLFAPRALPGVTDGVFSMKDLPIDGLGRWRSMPWNRMTELSFLRKTGVEFQNLRDYEDVYFGFASVLLADRIVYCPLDKALIIYQVNDPRQLSNSLDPRNGISAYEKLLTHKFCDDEHALHQIMRELVTGFQSMLDRSPDAEYSRTCLAGAKRLLEKWTTDTFFDNEEDRNRRSEILQMII
ncbi:MAG: glycosyltransferase [Lachnospiraceae bacterium]|nr:glycosyltransferase [Lachnospiraceae bacterium]